MRTGAWKTLFTWAALAWVAACSGNPPGTLSLADRNGPLPFPEESVVPTESVGGRTPGGTPGSLTVSSDGEASYAIELWVPPGRAGMQPALSLQYNSRGGEGLLGMGWGLGGLPQISRCGRTVAVDRYAAPIRYDVSDPFCLDGVRLTLVGGAPGGDGAEYRTERDSFAKIIAHAPDALGPTWFTAHLKDGRILTFGRNGVDQSATVQGPRLEISAPPPPTSIFIGPNVVKQTQTVRLAWALGLTQDRVGNTMRVSYKQSMTIPPPGPPGTMQMLYPDRIDYTGTIDGGGRSPTFRSVRFFYRSASAAPVNFSSFGYIAGLPWWDSQRLDRIEMWGPNPLEPALLRTYSFGYGSPSVTGRLLLASITEKDPAGVALGSTTFDWERGALDYDISVTQFTDINRDPKYRWIETLDLNGDGKDDVLYIPQNASNNFYARISDGNRLGAPVDTLVSYPKSGHPPFAIDYNSDGKDDLLLYVDHFPPSPNAPPVAKEDTPCVGRTVPISGNANRPSFLLGPCFPDRHALGGDLNGDGLSDVLTYVPRSSTSWQYQLNQAGTALGNPVRFNGPLDNVATLATPNKWELEVVDVDGDGAGELIGYRDNQDTRRSLFELGRSPRAPSIRIAQGTLWSGVDLFFGDVNGDHLPDAIAWNADGKNLSMFLDSGNGYSNDIDSLIGEPTIMPNDTIDAGIRVFDYDADGRDDVILRAVAPGGGSLSPGDHIIVMRSAGTILQPAAKLPSQVGAGDTGLIQPLDVNGDGLDDLLVYDNGSLLLYKHRGKKPDMLTRITDGLGAATTIGYEPVSNPEVYTPGRNCAYPVSCLRSKLWVVAEHSESNGSGTNRFQYRYSGGRVDQRGRGLLGVDSRTVLHTAGGHKLVSTYDLSPSADGSFYPYLSLPVSETETVTLQDGRTSTATVTTHYATHLDAKTGVYFAYAQVTDEQSSESGPAGSTIVSTRHGEHAVDDFGNTVDLTSETGDGERYAYHAEYENLPDAWLVQRIVTAQETSTTASHESAVRRRAFTWEATGLLHQEIVEPGVRSGTTWLPRTPSGPDDDGVKTLYHTFERHPNGQLRRETFDEAMTTGSPTPNQRFVEYTYADPDQVTPASLADALTHKQRTAFHPGLGVLLASDDDNGVVSKRRVDRFGRRRLEQSSGLDTRAISYGFQAGTPRPEITETLASGSVRIADFDVLGRLASERTSSRGDGQTVLVEAQYDPLGHGLTSLSLPRFANDTPAFSSRTYDNLGRIRLRQRPDASSVETRYVGLTSTRIDAKKNERRQTVDQSGRVWQSVEVLAATATTPARTLTTTYGYGPFGTLRKVTDPAGNVATTQYDRLGRKLHVEDPDAGVRDYTYTAFGDVSTETINPASAQPELVSYFFDNLGRPTKIASRDGITSWAWDTAAHGVGLLDSTTSPDGVVTSHTYDSAARLVDTTWIVKQQAFTITRGYDPTTGRLTTLTYPAVPGRPARFAVGYNYKTGGNLASVSDLANPALPPYFALLDSNAAGSPTNASGAFPHEQLGNGLTLRRTEDPSHRGYPQRIETLGPGGASVQRVDLHFDPNGNLDLRSDALAGSSESFSYDGSDRLLTWAWSAAGTARNVSFGYDDLGNFRSRTVAEDASGNVTYSYDGRNGAGPHGVTARNGQSYFYDGKGKQTAGPGRSIAYTWFELPARVDSPAGTALFAYDADQQRVSKKSSGGDESITIGGLYERRTHAGQVEHVFNIKGIGRVAAQVTWREGGGKDSVQYLHPDHLGSIDAITNESGGLVERLKYDPFGGRVDPTRLDRPLSASAAGERAGFTGHEHDDELGLVNMKGRIYDPQLGRFLTTDPIVAQPYYGQAYNRYSYVLNNPLSATDPSGFRSDVPGGEAADGSNVSGVLYYSTATPNAKASKPKTSRQTPNSRGSVIQAGLIPPIGWAPNPFNVSPRDMALARTMTPFKVSLRDMAAARSVGPPGYSYNERQPIGLTGEGFTPEKAMALLQARPNNIFPFTLVPRDGGDSTIRLGGEYDLNDIRYPFDRGNGIRVIEKTATTFTFLTDESHFDGAGGTIKFITTVDSLGVVYLEHEANAPNAGAINSVLAPIGAIYYTWPLQSLNLRLELIKSGTLWTP